MEAPVLRWSHMGHLLDTSRSSRWVWGWSGVSCCRVPTVDLLLPVSLPFFRWMHRRGQQRSKKTSKASPTLQKSPRPTFQSLTQVKTAKPVLTILTILPPSHHTPSCSAASMPTVGDRSPPPHAEGSPLRRLGGKAHSPGSEEAAARRSRRAWRHGAGARHRCSTEHGVPVRGWKRRWSTALHTPKVPDSTSQ